MKKPTKKRIAIAIIALLVLAGGITAFALMQSPQSVNDSVGEKSNEPLRVSDITSDKTSQEAQAISISAYIFKDGDSYFASGPEKQSAPLVLDFTRSNLNPEEYVTGTAVAQSSENKPPEAPQVTDKGPYVVMGDLTQNDQGDKVLAVTSIKEAKK